MHPLQRGSLQRTVLCRDACLLLCLWESCLRGHDIGMLGLDSFITSRGELLCLQLHPVYQLKAGDIYLIKPASTNSRQTSDAGAVTRTVPDEQLMSLPQWISLLLWEYRDGGRPTLQHLFSALQGGAHDHFDFSQPMQGPAIYARLKLSLQKANVYRGQSLHSGRRGRLQHEAAQGKSTEELLSLALINTDSVLKQKYLDPARHQNACRRVRQRTFD